MRKALVVMLIGGGVAVAVPAAFAMEHENPGTAPMIQQYPAARRVAGPTVSVATKGGLAGSAGDARVPPEHDPAR